MADVIKFPAAPGKAEPPVLRYTLTGYSDGLYIEADGVGDPAARREIASAIFCDLFEIYAAIRLDTGSNDDQAVALITVFGSGRSVTRSLAEELETPEQRAWLQQRFADIVDMIAPLPTTTNDNPGDRPNDN